VNKWFNIPIKFKENYINLQDVFLNASLQRSCMLKSSIDSSDLNLITDRFRHERTWLMFLYVLLEAHRDKREFWDQGRFNVFNNLIPFNKIHTCLNDFFLIKKNFY
jgi:hypothetical protein